MKYPTITEIKQILRYNVTKPLRLKIINAFIIGSEAKSNAKIDSDLDIGIVIEKKKTKSSIRFSEEYHGSFISESQKPKWAGRTIDFQFFSPEDEELFKISKLKI